MATVSTSNNSNSNNTPSIKIHLVGLVLPDGIMVILEIQATGLTRGSWHRLLSSVTTNLLAEKYSCFSCLNCTGIQQGAMYTILVSNTAMQISWWLFALFVSVKVMACRSYLIFLAINVLVVVSYFSWSALELINNDQLFVVLCKSPFLPFSYFWPYFMRSNWKSTS
jgi:hypothetical protein